MSIMTPGKMEANRWSLPVRRDTKRELSNLLVKESPLERIAGHGLVKIALKAGCMVDNFPFANIRSEAAILTTPTGTRMWPSAIDIPYNRSSLSLLNIWDAWFVIHEAIYLQEEMLGSKQGRMHGTFNRMYLVLLIVITFQYYQETAGDSGLPKDSNTVVGKPQLGEQKL